MVEANDQEPVPVEAESLADCLQTKPEIGLEIFDMINNALQEILPGSDYHERYQGISEVGLAIAVVKAGRIPNLKELNPLGWSYDGVYYNTSQDVLPFSANNKDTCQDTRTWAWNLDADEEALGGSIIEHEIIEAGRFAIFATANLYHLEDMPEAVSSHWVGGNNPGKGKFSNAGAKAVGTPETGGVSLVACSGLWEVHAHIVSAVFSQAVEMRRSGDDAITIDVFISTELEDEFEKVKEILATEGKTAAELSEDRTACNDLIKTLELDYARNAQRLSELNF